MLFFILCLRLEVKRQSAFKVTDLFVFIVNHFDDEDSYKNLKNEYFGLSKQQFT